MQIHNNFNPYTHLNTTYPKNFVEKVYKMQTFFYPCLRCSRLFCKKSLSDSQCHSILLPAAEGTKCGSEKWCRFGVCVSTGSNGKFNAIDGMWNPWSAWSDCTATCGTGIKSRTRECNLPAPLYGGDDCIGRVQPDYFYLDLEKKYYLILRWFNFISKFPCQFFFLS